MAVLLARLQFIPVVCSFGAAQGFIIFYSRTGTILLFGVLLYVAFVYYNRDARRRCPHVLTC
jgi:hypothetical protein